MSSRKRKVDQPRGPSNSLVQYIVFKCKTGKGKKLQLFEQREERGSDGVAEGRGVFFYKYKNDF